jgi:hypothetical protein
MDKPGDSTPELWFNPATLRFERRVFNLATGRFERRPLEAVSTEDLSKLLADVATGRAEPGPREGVPTEDLPTLESDGHGHFGGLGAAISVAEAIALGVAGNVAYQALVSAVGRYRKRVTDRSAKVVRLRREEVFDIAIGALQIANEVNLHPYQLNTAEIVLLNATENAAGDWNVVLGMQWGDGHITSVWVDIPAGDIATATIQVDGCEECRKRRMRRHG